MQNGQCPICGTTLAHEPNGSGRDETLFNCARCGPYKITGTALAMLADRLKGNAKVAARLSHAIRANTSSSKVYEVTSLNLDELTRSPLPAIPAQKFHFLSWAAGKLEDDRLGMVELPESDELAGLIGTIDGTRVEELLRYLSGEGLINFTVDRCISLTPSAWQFLEDTKSKNDAAAPANAPRASAESEDDSVILLAHCNTCGGDRNAFARKRFEKPGSDQETQWSDTYAILECCGCGTLSVRYEFWFSEWDDYDEDPITRQPRRTFGIKTTYWPPITKRPIPKWADQLEDEQLRNVFSEVYKALNMGLDVLSTVGARTVIDRAMVLRVGDVGSFKNKLEAMTQEGFLGAEEKKILEAMTDAGSAAAHRGYAPTGDQLNTIVATVETFIHREFILKAKVASVRASTPARAHKVKG